MPIGSDYLFLLKRPQSRSNARSWPVCGNGPTRVLLVVPLFPPRPCNPAGVGRYPTVSRFCACDSPDMLSADVPTRRDVLEPNWRSK